MAKTHRMRDVGIENAAAGKRHDTAGSLDAIFRNDHRSVMQGRIWIKDLQEQLRGDLGVEHNAVLIVFIQKFTSPDNDQRSVTTFRVVPPPGTPRLDFFHP